MNPIPLRNDIFNTEYGWYHDLEGSTGIAVRNAKLCSSREYPPLQWSSYVDVLHEFSYTKLANNIKDCKRI